MAPHVRQTAPRSLRLAPTGVAALGLLAACTGPIDPGSIAPTAAPTMAVTATATPVLAATLSPVVEPSESTTGPYREIALDLPNGSQREGRDYGDGDVGIVLTHMGGISDSQEDWAALAEELVAAGFRVVTFNHDAQAVWVQVLAATEYLREHGAKTVIAGGASLGAMASLRAAQEPGNQLSAVVWIAGVQLGSGYAFGEEDVGAVGCPMLFASGTEDEHGAADDAERLSEWAVAGELVLVESALHGTDILLEDTDAANSLRSSMFDFLDRVTAAPPAACG